MRINRSHARQPRNYESAATDDQQDLSICREAQPSATGGEHTYLGGSTIGGGAVAVSRGGTLVLRVHLLGGVLPSGACLDMALLCACADVRRTKCGTDQCTTQCPQSHSTNISRSSVSWRTGPLDHHCFCTRDDTGSGMTQRCGLVGAGPGFIERVRRHRTDACVVRAVGDTRRLVECTGWRRTPAGLWVVRPACG